MAVLTAAGFPRENVDGDGRVHVAEGPLLEIFPVSRITPWVNLVVDFQANARPSHVTRVESFGGVSGWSGSRPAKRLELSRCSDSEQSLGKHY